MRTPLFWVITRREVEISYPKFWNNLSVLSSARSLNPEDGTDSLYRNVGKILLVLAASYPRRRVIISYLAAEAWNHGFEVMSVRKGTNGCANKRNVKFHTPYERGKRKLLGIVKQKYLKYSYKVETLVIFKAQPPMTGSSHSSASANAGNIV